MQLASYHVRVSATRDEWLLFYSVFKFGSKICRNVPLPLAPLWELLRSFFLVIHDVARTACQSKQGPPRLRF